MTDRHETPRRRQYTDDYEPWRSPVRPEDEAQPVWRYLNFGRFVWMLHQKALWLSRIDLLGDPWELALAGAQLEHVVERHPITPVNLPRPEGAIERSERIIRTWRQQTFVSCWSAAEHESHALWRIYCKSHEGVAIRTTVAGLKRSVGELAVHPIRYCEIGARRQTPGFTQLVTEKRPMFEYEREVRVICRVREHADSEAFESSEKVGVAHPWDPEAVIQDVWVHPDADSSFLEAVNVVVEKLAPALRGKVQWSRMQARPPF